MKDYKIGKTIWKHIPSIDAYYCDNVHMSFNLDTDELEQLGAKPIEPDEVELEEMPRVTSLNKNYVDDTLLQHHEYINDLIQQLNSLKSRIKEVE